MLWEEILAYMISVRVKVITGSLVILENLFPQNYRYRYRLEIQMNLFNYHYRYRLGVRSHTFISIDSQLPSWKSFELISQKIPLLLPSWNVFELESLRKVIISNMTVTQRALSFPKCITHSSIENGSSIHTSGLSISQYSLVFSLRMQKEQITWDNQGKKTHININKFAGLCRDWVGAKNLLVCVCFFLFFFRSFLMGEKKHINKIPPKILGQSGEKFVYVFSSLCFFPLPR